ncbi:MAG: hypothetical protein IKT10_02515 [Clostridiales bacterium]|nr:hypothetical protein [Clostridiales bacterium]
MRKRYLTLLITILLSFAFLCGCSKPKETDPMMQYLGDYAYNEPAICMVYEPVEGELDDDGSQLYGIQYRKITDLDGLLVSGSTFLVYFYSSMEYGSAEITAVVEEMAYEYNGKLTVLMLDAMEYKTLMDKYDIDAVPEFVLIRSGMKDEKFDASSYEYWSIGDVILWLQEKGVV